MWKFTKFDEIMRKNSEFQGNSKFQKSDYTSEYLLNLVEKWMVRKFNFYRFGGDPPIANGYWVTVNGNLLSLCYTQWI